MIVKLQVLFQAQRQIKAALQSLTIRKKPAYSQTAYIYLSPCLKDITLCLYLVSQYFYFRTNVSTTSSLAKVAAHFNQALFSRCTFFNEKC